MMTFKEQTAWEKIKYFFSPSYRRRQDALTKAAIKWLMEHPEAPCKIDDSIIPDGFGSSYPSVPSSDWNGDMFNSQQR